MTESLYCNSRLSVYREFMSIFAFTGGVYFTNRLPNSTANAPTLKALKIVVKAFQRQR